MSSSHDMSFLEHLEALRKSVLRTIWIFVAAFGVCAYYSKLLFAWLQEPLLPYLGETSQFVALTAPSGWFVYLKTAFFAALIFFLPILLGQIFLFVNPGLKNKERIMLWPFLIFLVSFFYAGIAFGYFVVLPLGYKFMVQVYEGTGILFMPQISDYLSFTLKFLLAFGLMFDLPFLILIVVASGLVSHRLLSKGRPFVYVGAFILAAILTPPDYISQILMAVPFIILFELGMLLGWIFKPRSGNQSSRA